MPDEMSKTKGKPPPAMVEDYDSDESHVISGTHVQAHASKRKEQPQTSSRPKKAAPLYAASDSGYSSRTGDSSTNAPVTVIGPLDSRKTLSAPNSAKSPTAGTAKAKPVIHRVDSAKSTAGPNVSNTAAKREETYVDSTRRTEDRTAYRSKDRRYTLPNREVQPQPRVPNYQQPDPYEHSRTMPPPPRPRRANSTSQRPMSSHGLPLTPYYPNAQQSGQAAPVSGYYPQYPAPYPNFQYGSTGYVTGMAAYAPPSPVKSMHQAPPSPVTPTYPGYPVYHGGLSAREGGVGVSGHDQTRFMQPAGGVSRPAMSARHSTIPGPYPAVEYDTSSESASSEHDSEEDRRRHPTERRRSQPKGVSYRQRSKSRGAERRHAVVHNPHRPSVTRSYHTETAVPTTKPRRRQSSSRPDVGYRSTSDPSYLSSSENFDSDRTARAVVDRAVDRGSTTTSSQPSRRQSVSTNASRGTKATSLSSDPGYVEAIIEDKHGRRRVYLSKEQEAAMREQYEKQKALESLEDQHITEQRIADYQKQASGGYEQQKLSAEDVKKQNRKSMSHVSNTRSQKSVGSGSRRSRTGGLRIEAGGNTVLLEAGQELQVREDGDYTTLIIGSATGNDSAYYGSKSSGSRTGRSRTSRRIHEEDEYVDGYEKGL